MRKVGPKGQVVIPKRVRERLGIEPGDRVSVEDEHGCAVVRPAAAPGSLLGLLAAGPGSVGLADWEQHKRAERELEDAPSEPEGPGGGGSARRRGT